MSLVKPDAAPEAVIEAAFYAFRDRDGYALAAVASSASLQAFRDSALSEAHPQWRTWTADAIRANHPDMPLEAAEWQAKKLEQDRAAHEQRLLARFSDTHSIAELESVDSAELLHRALGAAPDGAISLGWCRPLGHVLESENTAYVLFWLGDESKPVPFDDPLVARLERVDCEWKLVLDPDSRWGIPGFRNIFFGVGSD